MTEEQQQIAIAEACGWRIGTRRAMGYGGVTNAIQYYWEKNGCVGSLPDYLNDLNAMHEAVKTLPQNFKPRYFSCLCAVVGGAISLHGYSEATEATAAQRAEAFLRTIEKWEETL